VVDSRSRTDSGIGLRLAHTTALRSTHHRPATPAPPGGALLALLGHLRDWALTWGSIVAPVLAAKLLARGFHLPRCRAGGFGWRRTG
jgi:hypothetical protein